MLIINKNNSDTRLWYGYEVDTTSKSKYVTRIGDTVLHNLLPIQNKIRRLVENWDGSFNYWLHPHNSLLKADGTPADLSGVTGNVMLYKPGYYFKLEKDGNIVRRMFSEFPLPGYLYRPPGSISAFWSTFDNVNDRAASVSSLQFDEDGSIIRDDITGLPIYQANATQFRGGNNNSANDNTYRSLLGVARTNVNRATIRSHCVAAGGHNGSYNIARELAQLATLEYASYDIQEAYNPSLDANGFRQGGLGRGLIVSSGEWITHNGEYPFVPNGVTAKLGNNSGVVSYDIVNWANLGGVKTVPVNSYRGFELWYEYLWNITDDGLVYHQPDVDGGKCLLYVCSDPAKFANPASDLTTVVPDGYEMMTDSLPTTDSWGWNEADNEAGDMLPISGGASANEGLCDRFYRNNSARGWFVLILFGRAASGTLAGSRVAFTHYRASAALADFGFRLCRSNPVVG